MITSLPTDTYYRGYRLSQMPNGRVALYYDADYLGEAWDLDEARTMVDDYHNAP